MGAKGFQRLVVKARLRKPASPEASSGPIFSALHFAVFWEFDAGTGLAPLDEMLPKKRCQIEQRSIE
ncbi:hypothetical protein CGZ80_20885 [Rhodopirellula sp. MGV]|nr:hypothetical protein CGZ80_20885 [Rhodopirellula sp. MGV]